MARWAASGITSRLALGMESLIDSAWSGGAAGSSAPAITRVGVETEPLREDRGHVLGEE